MDLNKLRYFFLGKESLFLDIKNENSKAKNSNLSVLQAWRNCLTVRRTFTLFYGYETRRQASLHSLELYQHLLKL